MCIHCVYFINYILLCFENGPCSILSVFFLNNTTILTRNFEHLFVMYLYKYAFVMYLYKYAFVRYLYKYLQLILTNVAHTLHSL